MRVIDLLNKIANGEEVPKKIVHHSLTGDLVWEFENNCQVEYGYKMNCFCDKTSLNDEVEVMGEDPEDKEITEHHDIFDYFTGYSFGETNKELLQQLEHNFQIVNEELDYLINKINKD